MAHTNKELVRELREVGYIKTDRIAEAFMTIDRAFFVPEELQSRAYENVALPIGDAQTISQPLVVAFMLELLGLQEGNKVLEVGTGSGWKSALIAFLIKTSSQTSHSKPLIYSMERIPALSHGARNAIESAAPDLLPYITFIEGDGSKGYESGAPYDRIIAAAASDHICEAWKNQLMIGGRIVAPIEESIVVVDKKGRDVFEQREYYGFSFVPLIKGE